MRLRREILISGVASRGIITFAKVAALSTLNLFRVPNQDALRVSEALFAPRHSAKTTNNVTRG